MYLNYDEVLSQAKLGKPQKATFINGISEFLEDLRDDVE